MKKGLLLIAAVCCLAACKKTGIKPGLFGSWELRQAAGGDFAYQDSVYKPGNGNIYRFNTDSTYDKYMNHTLSAHGIFHIRKNANSSTDPANMLVFDGNTEGFPITMDGATMTLITQSGWFENKYQKTSN